MKKFKNKLIELTKILPSPRCKAHFNNTLAVETFNSEATFLTTGSCNKLALSLVPKEE